jgi:hypothetical protein
MLDNSKKYPQRGESVPPFPALQSFLQLIADNRNLTVIARKTGIIPK